MSRPSQELKTTPNRREFFKTMGAGAAGLTLGAAATPRTASAAPAEDDHDKQVLYIGDDIALADTQYGKVKGYQLRGIYYFLGIPYGADTSGANRFMPPQKPKPWTDVFPAVWWGNTAPQIMDNRYANAYASFADHWNYDDVSEDCLRLNVFTPAVDDGKKRPVLVWLHGGGFTNGNGIEQDGYNGENLSRYGDVVFCSVNHRLGPIGFSDFSAVGGEKFAQSGNAGILDIIAALEWVHANIAKFGGDPDNVTIMGQSGGGAKVCTVVAMPAAKGLVHRAVALSGNITGAVPKEFSEKLGAYILREAGLTGDQMDELQQLPWREYIDIANRASAKIIKDTGGSGMMRGSFGPVGDGIDVPKGTFYSDPSAPSASIPMIFSSTFNEFSPDRIDGSLSRITLDGLKENLKERFGDKTATVVDAYAAAFPESRPVELWSLILSNRKLVVAAADAKVKQRSPVFMAWFGWQPPLFDGRMRAFHCLDICFWFSNTDLMLTHTGGGARPRKLSKIMADTLLRFMRTGDPNGEGLPPWPRYTADSGELMVLNDTCEVKSDPDREARLTLPA
ncbi:MAG: carboxylesterase family protein [Acidobacteriota bacterium]|jgi:para-nitrobenzyl esterase